MRASTDINAYIFHHSRWVILGLSSIIMMGNYYCFDIPAAMKDSMSQHFQEYYSQDSYEILYNTLFTAYSLPNVILPFVNGYLVDRFGSGFMLLLLSFFVLLGQTIFYAGARSFDMWIMICGRFVVGLGGESVFVALSNLITKHFRTKELSSALGITLATGNLGAMFNMILTPRIDIDLGVVASASFGIFVAFLAFGFVLLVICFDKQCEFKRSATSPRTPMAGFLRNSNPEQIKDFSSFIKELSDFKGFGRLYWYICACSFFLFSSILSWNYIAASYISEKWYSDMPSDKAILEGSNWVSGTWLTTVICGPLIGFFVDEYGVRTRLTMVAAGTLILGHLSMIYLPPFFPVVLIGIAYCIGYAATGPSVAYLTSLDDLGKANGIVYSLQNIGFFVVPYFVALIKIASGSYDSAQILLIFLAIAALFIGYKAYKENLRQGHVLEMRAEKLQDLKGGMVLELGDSSTKSKPLLESDQEYDDTKKLLDYGL